MKTLRYALTVSIVALVLVFGSSAFVVRANCGSFPTSCKQSAATTSLEPSFVESVVAWIRTTIGL